MGLGSLGQKLQTRGVKVKKVFGITKIIIVILKL